MQANLVIAEIIRTLSFVLSDESHVTYREVHLLDAINNACRMVVLYRPDASSDIKTVTLVKGAKQSLPSVALRLLDTYYNQHGKPVNLVLRKDIDQVDNDWLSLPVSDDIREVMYDERLPSFFYVYPPAKANSTIDLGVSIMPNRVVKVSDNFPLSAKYIPPVTEWVLYQMYRLDQQSPVNQQKAVLHSQQFYQQLKVKTQGDLTVSPVMTGGQSQ